MKLEVNKKHKKANVTKFDSRIKPILMTVLGTTLSISLLTGCYSHIDKDGVYISTDYATISSSNINNEVYLCNLEDIDRLKEYLILNPETDVLTINNKLNDIEFNEENYGFLRDYNIKVLDLINININPSFLESLGSIELLKIKSPIAYYTNPDYSKIDNLKRIEFYYMDLYDYPVFLSNGMISKLQSNGVSIYLDNVKLSHVISLNEGIDDIVNNLDINENSTDIDKLNVILLYILDNFCYDEIVANTTIYDEGHSDYVSSFYTNGVMDALYNKKGNIICGNYAALFQALANRIGLTSYYMSGSNHAWNMVCFNGERYYVDSTWLDTGSVNVKGGTLQINRFKTTQDAIKSGNGPTLDWYLENIYNVYDSSHEADFVPSNDYDYVEYIRDEKEPINLSDYLYELIISGERYIVNAGTVLGILVTLGIAKKTINIINKKENNNRKYR